MSFATDGRFINVFGQYSSPVNIFLSADDHIFVVAVCSGDTPPPIMCIARLTPDGALDTTYGKGGITLLNGMENAVLLPDGRMIASGWVVGTDVYRWAYSIVDANGKAGDPIVIPNVSPWLWNPSPAAMTLAPDGGILMVYADTSQIMNITKLMNTGELDTTFGTNGVATANFEGKEGSSGVSMVVRPNGKIVIAGYWYNGIGEVISRSCGILQLDGNGAPDTSFGTNGQTLIATESSYCSGLGGAMLLADGRTLFVSGDDSPDDSPILAVTADGHQDMTFGASVGLSRGDQISSILLDPQNHLLVTLLGLVSRSGPQEHVLRLTTEGKLDTTFGDNGTVAISPPPEILGSWGSSAARVQSDGRIVVLSGGYATMGKTVVVSRLWSWQPAQQPR